MPSIRLNGSPSISIRSAKVRNPFIRVADDVSCGRHPPPRLGGGLPLDPGGKSGPASAAQPGRHYGLDRPRRPHARGPLQPYHAAMRAVVVQRQRIDNAAEGERQPVCLARNGMPPAPPAAILRGACQQTICQKIGNVARRDRIIGDPPLRRLHPQSSVPAKNTRVIRSAPHPRAQQCRGDLIGPNRQRRGVTRHKNPGQHRVSSIWSIRAGFTAPRGGHPAARTGPSRRNPGRKPAPTSQPHQRRSMPFHASAANKALPLPRRQPPGTPPLGKHAAHAAWDVRRNS